MNARPFRIGLIGAGRVAADLHLPAILATSRVSLSALVDSVPGRARSLAESFGVEPEVAESISGVSTGLDGIIIATPNATHREVALAALRRGWHCLVEKPLATTVADGEAICEAAESAGLVVAVGYSTRFRNEVPLLKSLIDDGYFGRVRRFHFQEGTVGGWSPLSGYNLQRSSAGGGVLTVVGTHFLDRMLFWFGFPTQSQLYDDGEAGPESHAIVALTFEGGLYGTINLSKSCLLPPGLVIETERGIVRLGLGQAPLLLRPADRDDLEIVLRARGQPRFPLDVGNFELQLLDFVEACASGLPPMVPARHGLLSVRLLADLYARRRSLSDLSRQSAPIVRPLA